MCMCMCIWHTTHVTHVTHSAGVAVQDVAIAELVLMALRETRGRL